MKKELYLSTILGALAFSAAFPGIANAQDNAQDAARPAAENAESGVIIVTAQRRSEDVKKVPAAISVLGGESLQSRQIAGFEDISRSVPGLSFGAGGGPGLDNIQMRGISSKSGSATVGIYMDDVPITVKNAYNGAVQPRLFDLARVEVLRGPQGTLFGASSQGGAIRFISNEPDLKKFSASGNVEASKTSHGGTNYNGQAVLNVANSSGTAALRIGVDVGRLSGWVDNFGCCGTNIPGVPVTAVPKGQLVKSNVNEENWIVGRISGKAELDDTLTVTASLFAEKHNTDDTALFYPTLGLYKQDKEVAADLRDRIIIGSLTIEKDLGFAKLSSISSYFHQTFKKVEDGTFYNSGYFADVVIPAGYANNPNTFLIGQLPSPQPSTTRTRTISQEFRLTSATSPDTGDKFSWIVGLFLSQYDAKNIRSSTIPNFRQTFTSIYGVAPEVSAVPDFQGYSFPGDLITDFKFHTREKQIAVFANATYAPIPELKLSAGVRYNHAPGFYKQDLAGFFTRPPLLLKSNTSFNALTPKFSATYDVSREMTAYVTAAKGNRLGGGNYYIPESPCAQDLANLGLTKAPTDFDSDNLWNYEGGLKGRFLGNKLSINAAFFYIKWKDIQQIINMPICGATATVNIGDAESYGPEVEINATPLPGLNIGGAFSYTHAAIKSINPLYTTFGISPGQPNLYVPKYMASVRFDYTQPVSDETDVILRGDYSYTGSSYGSLRASDPGYRQPSYAVVNASIGINYKNYEVSLFAKNLLDNDKVIQIPSLLFVSQGYTLRPLTVGLGLKAKM